MAGIEVATGELMNTGLGGPCSEACDGKCKCPDGVGANLTICPHYDTEDCFGQMLPWILTGGSKLPKMTIREARMFNSFWHIGSGR